MPHAVIPDLVRNPGTFQENLWIPAFAGMTNEVALLPYILVKQIVSSGLQRITGED